jgi:hypothetical protein
MSSCRGAGSDEIDQLSAVAAVRNVRDMHKPVQVHLPDPWNPDHFEYQCANCWGYGYERGEWPCDTARLVYSYAEIERVRS